MENYDCGFDIANYHFRYRAGGFLLHEDRILFVKTKFNDSVLGAYSYVIGGGVHLGENSAEAICREFFEETGIHVKAERLAVVCENFFDGHGGNLEGMDCHTLEFYYLLSTDEDVSKIPARTDEGEELVWIPVENISSENIKPDFVRKRIGEILNSSAPVHIIEDKDKRG